MTRRSWVLVVLSVVLALASVLGVDGVDPERTLAAPVAGPLAAPDNSITLQPFLSGLTAPVLITHAGDNTGRLFVVEQSGLIKVVVGGTVRSLPFLDLTSKISYLGEMGLLGLAFHPNYETNKRFFVFYSSATKTAGPNAGGDITLEEYKVSGNPDVADPTPVQTLFSLPDRATNHNAGMIAFGRDGNLFISMGDEGGGGDPFENAQNLGSLYGKLLRIDVDNRGSSLPANPPTPAYSIPYDNPMIGRPDVRLEMWAWGLRNPWRWSFDRETGAILIGDVGQGIWEEIDYIPPGIGGINFGWDEREGAHCHADIEPGSNCNKPGLHDPILEYQHPTGCAVTGGYVYRGTAQPNLRGYYFFSDACSGIISKAAVTSSLPPYWQSVEAIASGRTVVSFGEDEAGELYVAGLGSGPGTGEILKIVQNAQSQPPGPLKPCPDRPRVNVQSVRSGVGTLQVTVTSTTNGSTPANALQGISFTQINNAQVTAGSQMNQTSPFNVNLAPGVPNTQFTVQRRQAGVAMQVNFSVTHACGPWPSFVGGGPNAP